MILALKKSFMASTLLTCGPKPSTIRVTHQSGLSQMTGIARMPATWCFAMATHATSVINPVGVMWSDEPGAAPFVTRNSSVKPIFFFLRFIKKPVGSVVPAAEPRRNIEIETRESSLFDSCFLFPLSPMIVTLPLLASMPVSSPPTMKCRMTSPKVLPDLGQQPTLRSRSFFSVSSMSRCQRHCCATVIAVRFVVVACARMMPVRSDLNPGRTVRRQACRSCSRDESGTSSPKASTTAAVDIPSFPRSRRFTTSTKNFCLPWSMIDGLPTPAPSVRRSETSS
mmetsp:Transcript_19952/g.68749  ORF Transcript_19952/g.68749 Transcript_19952/m.68749 type:complete len:282 (+) Transcript_19952:608-1453(+)